MPFPPPAVPSKFDVGDPNAGHAHFDKTGVTFYGTDGITPIFRFDFATAALSLSTAEGNTPRVGIAGAAIILYNGNANFNDANLFAFVGTDSSGVAGNPMVHLRSGDAGGYPTGLDATASHDASGSLPLMRYGLSGNQTYGALHRFYGEIDLLDGSTGFVPAELKIAGAPVPRGKLDEAHVTVNSGQNIVAAGLTTITGTVARNNAAGAAGNLDSTVTVIAGHTYKVSACIELFTSVAGDVVRAGVAVTAGGGLGALTPTPQPAWTLPAANRGDSRLVVAYFYASGAGNVTVAAQGARVAGTGNINAVTGSSIEIEDVGAG